MSYSDISGLELFQMPFGSSNPARQQQAAAQSKALQQQSGRQTAVQQQEARAVKPAASAVKKPDNMTKNAAENGCAMPEAGTKARDQAQDGKIQENVPEKQPASEQNQKTQDTADTTKPQAPAEQKEQTKSPQKELVLDMSSGSGGDTGGRLDTADDTEKRKAHEEAEAKRKAEWDAKQLEKKQKEAEVLQKLQSMSDTDIISASTKRISMDVERITRRNMKECVADHIQNLCREDPAFARLAMHPRKSMVHCFKYINRIAKGFVQKEMKYRDARPENGIYGCDVPDGLVYQWAEDYYYDADAPEDVEKEEKFVPRPYVNATPKAASRAKKQEKEKKKEEKQAVSGDYEQMSFV